MQAFKLTLIQHCRTYLQDKITALNAMILELTESANADTKSTAGDKHETSRAMVQLEQEKLGQQLKDAELQLLEFDKTDFSKTPSVVGQASLVETDKGLFFIATSIGKLELEGMPVFVISHKSPLALALNGAKLHDEISFNTVHYRINRIN